jgi:glycine cleavage system H protein
MILRIEEGIEMAEAGMKGLRFSEEHLWVGIKDKEILIGITPWLQRQLGEVTYVGLPEIGEVLERGEPFGEIETVRTIKELVAPVSGEVLLVNLELESEPTLANEDPMGEGWFMQIRSVNPQELKELMDEEEYEQLIEGQEEEDTL